MPIDLIQPEHHPDTPFLDLFSNSPSSVSPSTPQSPTLLTFEDESQAYMASLIGDVEFRTFASHAVDEFVMDSDPERVKEHLRVRERLRRSQDDGLVWDAEPSKRTAQGEEREGEQLISPIASTPQSSDSSSDGDASTNNHHMWASLDIELDALEEDPRIAQDSDDYNREIAQITCEIIHRSDYNLEYHHTTIPHLGHHTRDSESQLFAPSPVSSEVDTSQIDALLEELELPSELTMRKKKKQLASKVRKAPKDRSSHSTESSTRGDQPSLKKRPAKPKVCKKRKKVTTFGSSRRSRKKQTKAPSRVHPVSQPILLRPSAEHGEKSADPYLASTLATPLQHIAKPSLSPSFSPRENNIIPMGMFQEATTFNTTSTEPPFDDPDDVWALSEARLNEIMRTFSIPGSALSAAKSKQVSKDTR